jgi:hypothetical protein
VKVMPQAVALVLARPKSFSRCCALHKVPVCTTATKQHLQQQWQAVLLMVVCLFQQSFVKHVMSGMVWSAVQQ